MLLRTRWLHFLRGFPFIFIFLNCYGQNQENIPFKARYFPGNRKAFEAALQAFNNGQKGYREAFRLQSPALLRQALSALREVAQFNPSSYELNYLLGISHYNLFQYDSAVYYLNRLPRNSVKVAPDALLYQACALRRLEKYPEAFKLLEQFLNEDHAESYPLINGQQIHVKEELQYVRRALEMSKSQKRYQKSSLEHVIAKKFSAIGLPIFTQDGRRVLFAGVRVNARPEALTEAGLLHLYSGSFEPLMERDSLMADFTFTWISDDGRFVVGTTVSPAGDRELFGLQKEASGWTSWALPTQLSSSPHNEICGAFNTDLSVFYFISDRPGGLGGYDIYEVDVRLGGPHAPPRNLGRSVNSEKNEFWIFPHFDNQTLFFSSEGHNSLGGADIFMTRRSGALLAAPVNLGLAINTPFDEKAVYTDLSTQKIYVLRENSETRATEAFVFFKAHNFTQPILEFETPSSDGLGVPFTFRYTPPLGYDFFPRILALDLVCPKQKISCDAQWLITDSTGRILRQMPVTASSYDTASIVIPSAQSFFIAWVDQNHLPWIRKESVAALPWFGRSTYHPDLLPVAPHSWIRLPESSAALAAPSWNPDQPLPEAQILIEWIRQHPQWRLRLVGEYPEGGDKKWARLIIKRFTDICKKNGLEYQRFETEIEENASLKNVQLKLEILKM